MRSITPRMKGITPPNKPYVTPEIIRKIIVIATPIPERHNPESRENVFQLKAGGL